MTSPWARGGRQNHRLKRPWVSLVMASVDHPDHRSRMLGVDLDGTRRVDGSHRPGGDQPLLAGGEPGNQDGQLPQLGLIDDRCRVHSLSSPMGPTAPSRRGPTRRGGPTGHSITSSISRPSNHSAPAGVPSPHPPGVTPPRRMWHMYRHARTDERFWRRTLARLRGADRRGMAMSWCRGSIGCVAGGGSAKVRWRISWGGGWMPYLSRHAHAGDKHAWTGPDLMRPLSETGRREAHGLLAQLRDDPIGRILSSPAVRCLQTVEPLAARRGLTTETSEALGVEGDPAALEALLVDPGAGNLLVCSHGELIGTVLRRLLGEQLAADSWPKGSTWVLEVDGGQVQRSRYLPPLRLQDSDAGHH